ncbi:MAG: RagB/SusD family nutrient uptake outer membrane protein [Flavobacteriaceae bacterium]|nr:RagB/SusD family nutrient uptake outer membrane protein [Flavobacteriaceae bacterium]
MKKYLILFVVFASLFTSCDAELETFPTSQVAADEAFKNEGDFTNAVRGMYRAMLSGSYYGGQLQGYDVMTDNLLISEEGRKSQQFRHDWAYDPNSGFSGYMGASYTVIQNANFILLNIDNLEDGDFKNNIKGEALAGRALAHFDIVRYFAKIPTQSGDAGSSLAMPYVTLPDVNDLPSRITVSEYYANLVNDLTLAAGLVNANNGTYQMGKNAVNGILARVQLHNGNWQAAVDAANKVTSSIAERDNYVGIWNDSSDDGVIFKIQNDNVSNVTLGVPYSQTANGIKDEYVPDYAFYLQYDDSDIRKAAFFETSPFGDLSYNHIMKWYSSISTTSLGVVDAKILRASEVMLTKAEALAEMGQDGAALEALNTVRAERYSDFTPGIETGSFLKTAIALERRLELAFEGSRFSDLKRKGMTIQRSEFGHLSDGTGIPAVISSLDANDHRMQVPIPIGEMNLNPNMAQNPGYGN